MTPLQRIEAALAWLGELRAGATPGAWIEEDDGVVQSFELAHRVGPHEWNRVGVIEEVRPGDAALIVALTHPAVLDAVEAVLRNGANYIEYQEEYAVGALPLADALLATKPEGGK